MEFAKELFIKFGELQEGQKNLSEDIAERHKENLAGFDDIRTTVHANAKNVEVLAERVKAVEDTQIAVAQPLAEFHALLRAGRRMRWFALAAFTLLLTLIHYSEDIYDGLKWIVHKGK